MNRPRLFVTKSLLLTLLIACASIFSFGARGKVYAQRGKVYEQQQQPSSQKLYETAKRQFESGSHGQALETLEGLLKGEPDYAPALLLKAKTLIGLFVDAPPLLPHEQKSPEALRERKLRQARLMKAAAESLERFLQLKPDVERAASLQRQLDSLRVYAEPASKPESEWTFLLPAEATEKARFIRRPEPRYPEEARSSRLRGKAKLLMVLAADSTVKHILVLQSSHPLFTESALEAARGIVFEPAIKDGLPVSTAVAVEYTFHTY